MKIKHLMVFFLTGVMVSAKAQLNFGIKAGVNYANGISKFNGIKNHDLKYDVGYIVSADLFLPIQKNLLFQTDLQFESLHDKQKTESTNSSPGYYFYSLSSGKAYINYLNVPLLFTYKPERFIKGLQVGLGPTIGIGLSGKSKNYVYSQSNINGTISSYNYESNSSLTFGTADTTTKRVNISASVCVAYTLPDGLSFSLYMNRGLNNLANAKNAYYATQVFGVTAGYIFKRKVK
jgi:hypothetical protein